MTVVRFEARPAREPRVLLVARPPAIPKRLINIGWPKEKLSERVDVSVSVLEKHYDARTHEKKREGRKEFVDLM